MLQVRVIEDAETWRDLAVPWNALLDPADPHAIYLSHEWFGAWFNAFGDGQQLHVLVAEDGNDIRGVLPLQASQVTRGWLAIRQLQLMANGHSPCADLICRPQDSLPVRRAFAHHLRREAQHWEMALFTEVSRNSHLARLCELYPERSRDSRVARRAPFIPLSGTWEDYRSRISKRFLKVLRNNQNRVEREWTAEIEKLEEAAAIESALPDMFDIGERSWQGRSGSAVGSTRPNRSFYTRLAMTFAEQQKVRLWFLKLDGQRVAFEFHFIHAGVEFGLKTGYDVQFEKSGIGTFLDQHIVRQLFAEDQLHEYDLLGNADFYKERWTRHAREYRRIDFYGATWKARLLALWDLQLVPLLKQQDGVQRLREAMQTRRAARQETS